MVPIAFTPLSLGQWLSSGPSNKSRSEEHRLFFHRLSEAYGCRYVYGAASGNTALALLLRAMSEESGKRQVILPAYSHGSVALLVQSLGLEPVLVDSSSATLTQSFEKVKELCTPDTLCLMVSHVFGMPAYSHREHALMKTLSCPVIEDCTQAVGSRWNFRYVGSIGRACWISFGLGENLSVLGGGAILTDDEGLSRRLKPLVDELTPVSSGQDWKTWMMIGAARVATARSLYGMVWRFSRRQRSSWIAENYPTHQMGSSRLRTAGALWELVEVWSSQRRRNGEWLREALSTCKGVVVPEIHGGGDPAFNRFPVLIRHRGLRDQVREALWRSGIEAALHYPRPVHRALSLGYSKEKDPFPQASYMTERLLTLPVHSGVRSEDLAKMVEVVRRICG